MDDHGHFLVIGGQRCGTTYLVSQLKTWPGVSMAVPERPEPKAFLSAVSHDEYDARYFGRPIQGRMLGEKSTTYMDRSEAASRARACLPEARIIAVIRDPVDRAVSNFRFSVGHGVEGLAIEEALRPEAEDRPFDEESLSASPYHYLRRGHYTEALAPWISAFPASAVLVLEFDSLVSGESRSWRRVSEFLDLPAPGSWRPDPKPVNSSLMGDRPGPDLFAYLADYFLDETLKVERDLGVDTSRWRSHPTGVTAVHG